MNDLKNNGKSLFELSPTRIKQLEKKMQNGDKKSDVSSLLLRKSTLKKGEFIFESKKDGIR